MTKRPAQPRSLPPSGLSARKQYWTAPLSRPPESPRTLEGAVPIQPIQATRKDQCKLTVRTASRNEAPRIHELISANLEEGHLLPRDLGELSLHAERFVLALDSDNAIVACGELAPLSHSLAEVRSLVVNQAHRGRGLGRQLVEELRQRAQLEGFDVLCAFTHQPAYFARMGFSIVPHTWLPEKISADCRMCPLFRRCGQYAMLVPLEPVREARPADRSLHA